MELNWKGDLKPPRDRSTQPWYWPDTELRQWASNDKRAKCQKFIYNWRAGTHIAFFHGHDLEPVAVSPRQATNTYPWEGEAEGRECLGSNPSFLLINQHETNPRHLACLSLDFFTQKSLYLAGLLRRLMTMYIVSRYPTNGHSLHSLTPEVAATLWNYWL